MTIDNETARSFLNQMVTVKGSEVSGRCIGFTRDGYAKVRGTDRRVDEVPADRLVLK